MVLVDVLGLLATTEETVVRDKAVESACLVIEGLSASVCESRALPVVERLTKGDWFTARVSACGLFASTYKQLTKAKKEARLHLRK